MKNKGVQVLLMASAVALLSLTACGDKKPVTTTEDGTESQVEVQAQNKASITTASPEFEKGWIGDDEHLTPKETTSSDDDVKAEVVNVVIE